MDIRNIIGIASKQVFEEINEGVHVIDKNGFTIMYNRAMAEIEGLEKEQVLNQNIKDVYPDWTVEISTLLKVLVTGEPILKKEQTYLNFIGKRIMTSNSTFPIYEDNELVGAVEIAQNLTKVTDMSEQILELQEKLMKPQKLSEGIKQYNFDQLIGKNAEYLDAIRIAKKASMSKSSVLITGETGTGKEMFAQSIHFASERKNKTFIAQNCAAMPETLLESILFGTKKGSFTGAQDRSGLFEQANGGTLFLDEINSMSLGLQAKILRVLQESYIRRVGGDKDIPVDVRIIAATNEDPWELINQKKFRKDLFYRINVLSISIPNLRDRREDISLLSKHFIDMYNFQMNKDAWMFSEELQVAMRAYSWPGNIRELKNFIEASLNMIDIDDHIITKEHLPTHVKEALFTKKNLNESLNNKSLPKYIEDIEKSLIAEYLVVNHGNVTRTAKDLGVSRQNLQHKIKKYNIL